MQEKKINFAIQENSYIFAVYIDNNQTFVL